MVLRDSLGFTHYQGGQHGGIQAVVHYQALLHDTRINQVPSVVNVGIYDLSRHQRQQ
jgi:hypothetical protein